MPLGDPANTNLPIMRMREWGGKWALALKSYNFLFLLPLGEILDENSISAVETTAMTAELSTEPGLFSQQAGFPKSKGK